ncbi:mechanosensitive ion channel family protein [Helicobacter sp. 11S02596-1]|uniref:mechanosensitive ion channel domain-containing protein n=1 Tax=Helicobacter sp. 11S02596-1 TaxID=1476194 RepID=UPI000BDA5A88|nr:mechanosensitive ion channel family protein [Helicobacter sp. 11S02596-1]PAF44841.1 mechanosensitive ion channel protein [Helicobacter sp. 11S02596-1]
MKKMIFACKIIFFSVFFGVFAPLALPTTLKATEPDFVDLYVILKQIDKLNTLIATTKKDPQKLQESTLYADQKNHLMKELVSKITHRKEKIGINIEQNKTEQDQIKQRLKTSTQIQDIYAFSLDKIRLDSLWLDQKMYEFLETLRQKIDFFSQKEDIIKIISPYLIELNQKEVQEDFFSKTLQTESQEKLKEPQIHIIKTELKEYQIKLQTYIEIINYIQKNPQEVLPQSVAMSIGMEWVLEKIDHYIPLTTHNLGIAKVVLSLVTLILLLGCRKIVARIIMKLLDFFIKFTRHNREIQNKIRNDIIAPVSVFLLVYSFDISLDILYYPSLPSIKLQIWFGVVYIALLAWFVISLLKGYGTAFITTIAQKSTDGFRKEVINLILKIIYFIVIVIAILAILKHLGFNISAIIASLGIGGLAVALAVKDMLANFFASVMLLFDNSFSQGDWIVCGDIEGTVVEMGLRRTSVRTFDNALLFVPNSELANRSIRNWNRRKVGRRIKMNIGLTYDTPAEKLQKCVKEIKEMLLNNPHISKDSDERGSLDYEVIFKKDIISMDDYMGYKSTLFVFVDELAESSINILIYCFSKSVVWGEFLKVKEDVILKIMAIVENNGLSFAFPSQSVYVETFPKTLC